MTTTNKSQRKEPVRKFREGLAKHLKGAKSISLAGTDFKPKEIDALFAGNVEAWDEYEATKLAAHASLLRAEASDRDTQTIRRAFRGYVLATYGDTSPTLADFGVAPKKRRRQLTVEEKKVAFDKLIATRKARGTMGKRAKEKIVGTVPAPATDGTKPVAATATNGSSVPHVASA